MKKIFFPGSFNPFTAGHADILERILLLTDKVTVGIGMNIEKQGSKEAAEKNADAIKTYISKKGLEDRVEVLVYSGLTGEVAKKRGADCLVRGVRTSADYEYEYSLAAANRDAFGIETILIPSDPALSFISSTMIRDLIKHNRENLTKKYLPKF